MKRNYRSHIITPDLPRRRFVQGLAAGGALLGMSSLVLPASARAAGAPVLTGTEFDLVIAETPVDFTGRPRMATAVNGSIPAPTLRWREGDTVTLRVTNRLREAASIHWHGILLPFQMDGVPGISYPGIAPGETFVYRFKVRQSGTYWYHSHSGFQEQTGMYGAMVVEPADAEPIRVQRDYVVQFSDWTDEDPNRVFAKLKTQSDYYNFNQPTAGQFLRDASREGLSAALERRRMWNRMRMNPTDLADVSAYTYTYLINGATPAGNWTGLFRPGEKLRLRFINSGAMTFFDVRIPGLKMTVVQADGQNVDPVTVDEIRIGVAETYDVIVEPKDQAYTIFAQSMDRTGYARGTLAPRPGMSAEVPALDRPASADHDRHDGRHGRRRNGRNARHGPRQRSDEHGRRRSARASCDDRIRPQHRHARRHAAHQPRRSRHRPAQQRAPRAGLRRPAHDRRADRSLRAGARRSSCT